MGQQVTKDTHILGNFDWRQNGALRTSSQKDALGSWTARMSFCALIHICNRFSCLLSPSRLRKSPRKAHRLLRRSTVVSSCARGVTVILSIIRPKQSLSCLSLSLSLNNKCYHQVSYKLGDKKHLAVGLAETAGFYRGPITASQTHRRLDAIGTIRGICALARQRIGCYSLRLYCR